MVGRRRLEFKRLAVGALVDDALSERPGIDDFRNHARQRRLRRHASQLDDQLGPEGAHRGEFQSHIGLVGKAGILRDLIVHLLAPSAHLGARDRSVEARRDDLGDQLADLRPGAVDDRPQSADPVVEIEHPIELVGDRLRARNVRHGAAQRGKEAGGLAMGRRVRRRRVRLDIDKTSIDLPIGGPTVNRRNRLLERPVVEHRAVDE